MFDTMVPETKNYTSVSFPTDHYFIRHDSCGSDVLVITFERAGGKQERPNPNRPGWGHKFIRKRGFDGLYIMPAFVDWYRQQSLPRFFEFLKASGFFRQYRRVVLYGSSMGGYAAMQFSDIVQPDAIIAFNPQTSLNKTVVPWENRYDRGLVQDWEEEQSDAVRHIHPDAELTLFVDPFNKRDMSHARRITDAAPQARLLKIPFGGHETANALRDLGALSTVVEGLILGDFDASVFHNAVRERRKLENYRSRFEFRYSQRQRRAAFRSGHDDSQQGISWAAE
ncbi:alpha/beta fold hydrolase [Algicella marina]|uniref:Alpha/beta hydrolase n=1 Tax=Algicella marina TaxID=2683284 RepID=A0A6P1SZM3_9RHOB|nr:hypothetical protein [Algicella marina]QHQ33692.1 hypothetical protein GO499_00120 [Algicella marina]